MTTTSKTPGSGPATSALVSQNTDEAQTAGPAEPPYQELIEHAQNLGDSALAPSTRRAYLSDLRLLAQWLTAHRLQLTVESLAAYLAELDLRGSSPATLARRVQAVRWARRQLELPSHSCPTRATAIRNLLRGARRRRTSNNKRRPLTPELVRAALAKLERPSDRALLLVAFVSALRASELVALRWTDVEDVADGVLLSVRKSKTDQEGRGRSCFLARSTQPDLCPVRALGCLRPHGVADGRVFPISTRTVSRRIRAACVLAGVSEPQRYSAHSARAGMLTTAAMEGCALPPIMAHSGHADPNIAMAYVRPGRAVHNPAPRAVLQALERGGELNTNHAGLVIDESSRFDDLRESLGPPRPSVSTINERFSALVKARGGLAELDPSERAAYVEAIEQQQLLIVDD